MPKAKVKVKANFSAKKLAKKLDKLMVDGLNVMGRNINLEIRKNTAAGIDIHGDRFESLKDSTKAERARLGFSGPPLNRTGNLSETTKKPATVSKPEYIIEMVGKSKRTGKIYGAYHNQGFTNSPKSRFPGTKVPKREWFGIPKNMEPGEPGYERAMLEITKRIGEAFKTNFKVVGAYKA